jgi:threonine synthase
MYLFTASQFRDRVSVPASEQVVHFVLEDATFVEAFEAAGEFARAQGITAERGFFNPGRREGLKLAWLEAVDQVPRAIDWYVQAVSSGMGVYGVFKGAAELQGIGRLERLPRLLCVQQESCAPMVTAWADRSAQIRGEDIVARPAGIAEAILRGNPSRAYPYVREMVVKSGGTFLAVSEREIRTARSLVEDLEGLSPCFAAAAAVAGVVKLRGLDGLMSANDTVLINLSGSDRQRSSSPSDGAQLLERSNGSWRHRSGVSATASSQ